MTNTLQHGEKLLVLELFYTPKQGDIIVCQDDCPQLGFDNPIVKRVIATEGQTITMDPETWTVTVDGIPLEEDYVLYYPGRPMGDWDYGESYTVPEGYVFVMGDNRTGSWDSRDDAIGPIDERYIIGKVIFRFAPFDSFGPVS
jgi:signal peptidase I